MKSKFRFTSKGSVVTLIYVAPVLLFMYVLAYDINPTGYRHMEYTLDTGSPVISKMFPAHRLARVEAGKQDVRDVPVYFTVRYPHRYESARVAIDVFNPSRVQWRIGLQVQGEDDWSYYLQEPNEHGTVVFDLAPARITDHSIRFMIAIDEAYDIFSIDDVNVELTREPLL